MLLVRPASPCDWRATEAAHPKLYAVQTSRLKLYRLPMTLDEGKVLRPRCSCSERCLWSWQRKTETHSGDAFQRKPIGITASTWQISSHPGLNPLSWKSRS